MKTTITAYKVEIYVDGELLYYVTHIRGWITRQERGVAIALTNAAEAEKMAARALYNASKIKKHAGKTIIALVKPMEVNA